MVRTNPSASVVQSWISRLFNRKSIPIAEPIPAMPKIVDDLRTSQLTVKDFRSKSQLVAQAEQQIFSRRIFDWMVGALENSHPAKVVFSPTGINPNDRAIHQAKIEGYQLCLNDLLSMRTHQPVKKELVATFGTKPE